MDLSARESFIEFVRDYYNSHSKVPSIKEIIAHRRSNNYAFYRCFPGGLPEVCSEVGIPQPSDRIRKVQGALSRKAKKRDEQLLERTVEQPPAPATPNMSDRLKDYEMMVTFQERDAMEDMSKIPAFAREYVAKADPALWEKLRMLTTEFSSKATISLDQLIIKSMNPSYEELAKNAILLNKRLPNFRKYIVDSLNAMLEQMINQKEYLRVPALLLKGVCDKCGRPLHFDTYPYCKGYRLMCPNCGARFYKCSICGEELKCANPPYLFCSRCGCTIKVLLESYWY